MSRLSNYAVKPSATTDIDRRLASEFGMQHLWCPGHNYRSGTSPFPGAASPEYDRIQTQDLYVPIDVLPPLAASTESGSAAQFNGMGTDKSAGAEAWITTSSDLLGFYPDNQVTLFAVCYATGGGTQTRTIATGGGLFRMAYKHSTTELTFIKGASTVSFVLPEPINDGVEHTVVMSYDPGGASPRVRAYLDGLQVGQAAGPVAAVNRFANFAVGAHSAGDIGWFNGVISLAGSANTIWHPAQVRQFAQSPFEVLYPTKRRINIGKQLAARDFAGPMMGAQAHAGSMLVGQPAAQGLLGSDPSNGPLLNATTGVESALDADTGICTE